MKRSHEPVGRTQTPLGALEFAAALNGDDARTVLSALKRFSKTIRRERRQALLGSHESDDDESLQDDDEEEELLDDNAVKKAKKPKEEWMEDTKSYNVPFVGTSVAKGDTGSMVAGEWPTGFLKAYLTSSPMAVELTCGDLLPPAGRVHRRLLASKQTRASHKIHVAYLEALAELITAHVPVVTLERSFGIQPHEDESKDVPKKDTFVSIITRDRLAGIMSLISDETGHGKGKAGGCGPLTVPALDILSNLAATSLGAAREITRILDSSLRDGSLRILLKPPKFVDDEKQSKTSSVSAARTTCLRLASVLAEWQDAAITSYITTRGSRERKINPGILYLALRQGLDGTENYREDGEYMNVVARLLRACGLLLPGAQRTSLLSKRDLLDFFSGDALINISQLATYVLPFTDYEKVLSGQDKYPDSASPAQVAGIEGRRLLFCFLADKKGSPFLARINRSKTDEKALSHCAQQLVRAMIVLLQSNGSLLTQKFLVHCLWMTPPLMPHFFRLVTVPDVNQTFAFVARMSFLLRLVREAPPASTSSEGGEASMDTKRIDRVVLSVVPANLKKHVLSKAMHSSNALVVSETLKLLCAILERFRLLRDYVTSQDDDAAKRLLDAFVRRLPDLQLLLSVRSRFDPFSMNENVKASAVVTGHVCKVVDAYAQCLPETLVAVKYDWIKLLPDDTDAFCSSSPLVQFQLLQTLETILALQAERGAVHKASSKAIEAVLSVMLRTQQKPLYKKVRSIALQSIRVQYMTGADDETKDSIEYETSLWADGLTKETIREFCSLLNDAGNSLFKHTITVAQAWKKVPYEATLPPVCFSALLTMALTIFPTMTEHFALLTCQVAAKCLLFHHHPLPLAALIVHFGSEIASSKVAPGELLYRYSCCLLSTDKRETRNQESLLKLLVSGLYSKNCFHSVLAGAVQRAGKQGSSLCSLSSAGNDEIAAVRQCLHMLSVASTTPDHADPIMAHLRSLIPLLVKTENADTTRRISTILEHPLVGYTYMPWTEVAFMDLVLLSGLSRDATGSSCPKQIAARATALKASIEGGGSTIQVIQNADIMREIVFFSLLKTLVPGQVTLCITREVLCLLCVAAKSQNHRLLPLFASLVLHWVGETSTEKDESRSLPCPLDTALDTWRVLVGECEADEQTYAVVHTLEAHLSRALASGRDEEDSLLYSLLIQSAPSETIQLALRPKVYSPTTPPAGYVHVCSFLSTIVASDPVLFGTSLLKRLAESPDRNDAVALLKNGFLDQEIEVLVQCTDILSTSYFDQVQDDFVTRGIDVLCLQAADDRGNEGSRFGEHFVPFLSQPGMLKAGQVEKFLNRSLKLLQSNDRTRYARDHVLDLSYELLCLGDSNEIFGSPAKRNSLFSIVFVRLLQRLQLSVKRHSKHAEKLSMDAGDCLSTFKKVFNFINKKATRGGGLGAADVSKAMTAAIKMCLKHGLAGATSCDARVSESCLRLVRLLLVEVSESSSSLHELKSQCILLEPSRILAMVVTHSRFAETLTSHNTDGNASDGDGVLLELVRLLLVCTSMSRDTVSFESEVWDSLLSAYNAGMTLVDVTLRRLFCIYNEALIARREESHLLYAQNFRWKGMPGTGVVNSNMSSWDWLIDGLDVVRVRATLCQFPVHSRLDAGPISDVEVWLSDTCAESTEYPPSNDVDTSSSSDSGDSSSDVPMGGKDSENHDEAVHGIITGSSEDKWQGAGADLRYCPAFVLPLILAALENSLLKAGSSLTSSKTTSRDRYDVEDEQNETALREFVLIAQRLCDKGALSLALGSLCSDCASLRKVAVSVLAHLKKAIDSKEARKLSSWRERPQLALVVDSVQRGLAVRIAVRSDPNKSRSPLMVPKVPVVSAVFLARASLIIAKSGDPMFGQINRYFLRLENGRGAFRDMNRLPSFISLFCSSADEPGQARRERMWSLQLLKDSFVEAYCYRMVASCHAPELLLTTFGSFSTRQDDDQLDMERILLLDTVTSLLQFGGRRAALHLIGRIGLLSWLRGQLEPDKLPTIDSKTAFLRLVSKAVEKGREFLADESSDRAYLLAESRALVPGVASLYGDSGTSSVVQRRGNDDSLESFAAASCSALRVLAETAKELGSVEDVGGVQHYGIPLSSAACWLQKMPVQMLGDAIWCMCIAPLCKDNQPSDSADAFSFSVLSFLGNNESDEELTTAILQRVALVTSMCVSSFGPDCPVLVGLLSCRAKCFSSCRESRQAWLECLETVVEKTVSSESVHLGMAKAILDSSSRFHIE